ncbi:hypothetical protein GCM10022235_30150 [Kribbella ginsengisoli]|uniref:Uncharacterized protein n=1 Tax=Kribbella ginsengisoli TaxID=363865 RepID=A0ABP6X134_9ACTN
MSTDGIADGVSDVDVEAELVVDGLLLDLSSSLPQATVAKSNETAEAARATRLMVWDMTILLLG